MNKKNSIEETKIDLSVISDEEKASNQKSKINYEITKTPKQTTVNLNRVISSSTTRKNSSSKAKSGGLSNEQKTLIAKAHATRHKQDNVMVGDIKAKIANNVVLEAKASYYESLAKYKDKRVTLTPSMKDTLKSAGKESVNAIQSAFSSQDDVGSQTVGGAITATATTIKAVKIADKANDAVVDGVKNIPTTIKNTKDKIVKVGNKAYQIYGTADKIYLTVKQSMPLLKGGFVPMKNALIANALKNGLHKTANIKRIIELAKKIKKIYTTTKKVAKNVKQVYKYTIKVVKSVAIDLKLKGNLTHDILKQARNKAKPFVFKAKVQSLKAVNEVGKRTTKTAVKGGAWAVNKGIPKGIKGAGNIVGSVGGVMASSDDMMIKGLGHATTVTKYTIKTMATATKLTAKAIKTTAQKTEKAGKTAYNGMKYARNNGLKATWKKAKDKAKEKTSKAVAEAGKSAVNLVVNLAKKLLGKMAIPAIAVLLLISVVSGGAGGLGSVVGYYLSGEFLLYRRDESFTATDVAEYLSDDSKGAEYIRNEYIKSISSGTTGISQFLKSEGGAYDKIILHTDNDITEVYRSATTSEEVENAIRETFWGKDALIEILQPLFYSGLLSEFGLKPTEEEASRLLRDIVFRMFSLQHFEGTGESCNAPHSCGYIHAKDDCCNVKDVIHTEYVCEECCELICPGHITYTCNKANTYNHVCTDDCQFKYSKTYCEKGCEFNKCNGTKICEGHSLYCCYIVLDDVDEFLDEYFVQPIARLEELGEARTSAEDKRLSTLKDYYSIVLEIIKESSSP